ncbi:MAG: OmpA family protein [Planctomycetota bacterium]
MQSGKWLLTVLMAIVLVPLVGCNGTPELKDKLADRDAKLQDCLAERDTLREKLEAEEAERQDTEGELEEARQELEQLSDLKDELEKAAADRKERVEELRNLVEGISGMSVEERDEGDFIVIENEILFPSGQITLTDEAQEALDSSVVEYLNEQLEEDPDQQVRVDGHTDGEPISASDWEDNYHLSVMRAHSVMMYLAENGVPEETMYIVGFGPNRPLEEPSEPEEPVEVNRRVEIMMVPDKDQEDPAEMLERLTR